MAGTQQSHVTAPHNSQRSHSKTDFSFAFRNSQFADRTLKLHVDHGAPADSLLTLTSPGSPDSVSVPGRYEVKEVPVSTLVLVARSEYFKKMFTGSFAESGSKGHLDVHLSVEDEPQFMDLLFFMYSGSLPKSILDSFSSALKLLILADRFDVQDCIVECLEVLATLLPAVEVDEALLLLSLPPSLQQTPLFKGLTIFAKDKLVEAYSSLLGPPCDSCLLKLPEICLVALLESDDLEVESEDVVVEAAVAWICHNYSTPRGQAEAIARIVLPRVRFQALSPKMTLSLGSMLEAPNKQWRRLSSATSLSSVSDIHGGLGSEEVRRERSTDGAGLGSACRGSSGVKTSGVGETVAQVADFSSRFSVCTSLSAPLGNEDAAAITEPVEHRKDEITSVSCLADSTVEQSLDQVQELSHEAVAQTISSLTRALVGYSEQCLVQYGSIPASKSLSLYRTGQACQPPRKLCQPPFLIHLDIPLGRCQEWQPSNFYLASSSLAFYRGKWFTLHTQVTAEDPTLGLYLSCEREQTFVEGSARSFNVKCSFNVRTSISFPAYQAAGTLKCTFDEDATGWGLTNALNVSWERMLEESDIYFPDGALCLRADVWLLEDER